MRTMAGGGVMAAMLDERRWKAATCEGDAAALKLCRNFIWL
jgi:hypothetical protein